MQWKPQGQYSARMHNENFISNKPNIIILSAQKLMCATVMWLISVTYTNTLGINKKFNCQVVLLRKVAKCQQHFMHLFLIFLVCFLSCTEYFYLVWDYKKSQYTVLG